MSAQVPTDYQALYDLYQKQSQDYNALQVQMSGVLHELYQLKKMIFGSRHERFVADTQNNAAQLKLDISVTAQPQGVIIKEKQITYSRTETIRPINHPGRMRLPESLRREQIIIEPDQDTTGCRRMDEEITEILDYKPGELFVRRVIRPKYSLPDGRGVIIGSLPARPIDKLMAGEGLLAQLIIDKYQDHLPLYRQMQRFERGGLKLPYSTLTEWVGATCELIEPLYEALKKEVLHTGYLHVDETPIKVLDKDKKGTTHRGFYWLYQNSIDKIVLFDYQEGRGREGPMDILQNFRGYLQTDGYIVYDQFEKNKNIVLLGCMAHARRMFTEALNNDQQRAGYVLGKIQQLYAIERACKEEALDYEQTKARRQQQAITIFSELQQWMKEQYMQVLPSSAIGKALGYAIQRWEKLYRYTTEGFLNIDNNPVENSVRPVALGRKNYLFVGSHQAARRSAMLYSLLGTAKLHNIEPYQWLKTTLAKIAQHPINRIAELLPHKQSV